MYKIIEVGSWGRMGDRPAELVKISSRGLIGNDLSNLIKRAGHVFADQIRQLKFASDEHPVHLIALGATEAYGPNRNGDGFTADTCRQCHSSFKKLARVYHNHQNKDPAKSYGPVKLSAFNEAMKRVELLVLFNGSKEAAERNGGLVEDSEVLEKIARGEDIPFSMACRVAYDVCNSCRNKAASRAEYCGPDDCPGGGCKDNLTKVGEDGTQVYVDNPNPEWFDISKVGRPADRGAYGSVAHYMQKAASGQILGGAALAEAYGLGGIMPFSQGTAIWLARQVKLAAELNELELHELPPALGAQSAVAFGPEFRGPVDLSPLMKMGATTFGLALKAMASYGVVLPPEEFFRWSGAPTELGQKAASYLPGVFGRLTREEMAGNPFRPGTGCPTLQQRKWAEKLASDHSVRASDVTLRMQKAALREVGQPPLVKTASVLNDPEAESLARQYALYKLAFLDSFEEDNVQLPLTRRFTILQNYVF